MANGFQTAAYYFPNWHVDPANERFHGKGWTEWQLMKYATPRFEGHQQPKVPLWGYEDEADPKVMEKKIDKPRLIMVWTVFCLTGIGLRTAPFFPAVWKRDI